MEEREKGQRPERGKQLRKIKLKGGREEGSRGE
jgi:hypothetical protein